VRGGKVDGQDEDYKVAGIPHPRNINKRKSDQKERIKDHLHCGCHEDVALADFFIWKHWYAESGGYKEGMKEKIMDPRTRCFVVTAGLNHYARLFVDDFFTNGKCSPAAFLSTYANVDPRLTHINSSAAECGNGSLHRIHKSMSYMSQD
jgi:hypothetical protein